MKTNRPLQWTKNALDTLKHIIDKEKINLNLTWIDLERLEDVQENKLKHLEEEHNNKDIMMILKLEITC